jgi:hypothetical protein
MHDWSCGLNFGGAKEYFLIASRPTLGTAQHLMDRVSVDLSLGGKMAGI